MASDRRLKLHSGGHACHRHCHTIAPKTSNRGKGGGTSGTNNITLKTPMANILLTHLCGMRCRIKLISLQPKREMVISKYRRNALVCCHHHMGNETITKKALFTEKWVPKLFFLQCHGEVSRTMYPICGYGRVLYGDPEGPLLVHKDAPG